MTGKPRKWKRLLIEDESGMFIEVLPADCRSSEFMGFEIPGKMEPTVFVTIEAELSLSPERVKSFAEEGSRDPILPHEAERRPKLVYAAFARCPCGAGLAYRNDPKPNVEDMSWRCSAELRGKIGNPNEVHMYPLPFALYQVDTEFCPIAGGQSTRPPDDPR